MNRGYAPGGSDSLGRCCFCPCCQRTLDQGLLRPMLMEHGGSAHSVEAMNQITRTTNATTMRPASNRTQSGKPTHQRSMFNGNRPFWPYDKSFGAAALAGPFRRKPLGGREVIEPFTRPAPLAAYAGMPSASVIPFRRDSRRMSSFLKSRD